MTRRNPYVGTYSEIIYFWFDQISLEFKKQCAQEFAVSKMNKTIAVVIAQYAHELDAKCDRFKFLQYEFLNEQMLNQEYQKVLEVAWFKKFKEQFLKVENKKINWKFLFRKNMKKNKK